MELSEISGGLTVAYLQGFIIGTWAANRVPVPLVSKQSTLLINIIEKK